MWWSLEMFKVPEKYRIKNPLNEKYASSEADGNNGQFRIKTHRMKRTVHVQASDGGGWEHVSVSLHDRCPTWTEMCIVKDLFWGEEDCVVQFHPPKTNYVNKHKFCLHLWRKIGSEFELPPTLMV